MISSNRTHLAFAALIAALAASSPATIRAERSGDVPDAAPPARPPAPRPAPASACQWWRGHASGNDPDFEMRLMLCPAANDRVVGTVRWSSTVSGWNQRAVDGAWSEGHTRLLLRDVSIVASHPAPGWRFCTIDRYELVATRPDRLEGTYDASACRDHASVAFERIAGP